MLEVRSEWHNSRAHHDSFAVFPSGCGFGFIAARENGPGPPSALLLTEISARHQAILNRLLTSRCDGHHKKCDFMVATPAHSVAPMCWAPTKRRTNFLVGVGWVHCVAQTVQWIKSRRRVAPSSGRSYLTTFPDFGNLDYR